MSVLRACWLTIRACCADDAHLGVFLLAKRRMRAAAGDDMVLELLGTLVDQHLESVRCNCNKQTIERYKNETQTGMACACARQKRATMEL